jgi:excisionase family DNA binding protein
VIYKVAEEYIMIGDDWPDLLTTREAAKIFRVSPLTIKRWGNRGKLNFIKINSRGDRRYKKDAVLYLLGITPQEEREEKSST